MNVDSASAQISKRIDQFDRFHTLGISCREPVDSIHREIDSYINNLPSAPGGITFTGIGENWHELDLTNAKYVLQYILSHDIARYFSNGMFDRNTHSWAGYGYVASATCETGVVVLSSNLIGMLWCHDED